MVEGTLPLPSDLDEAPILLGRQDNGVEGTLPRPSHLGARTSSDPVSLDRREHGVERALPRPSHLGACIRTRTRTPVSDDDYHPGGRAISASIESSRGSRRRPGGKTVRDLPIKGIPAWGKNTPVALFRRTNRPVPRNTASSRLLAGRPARPALRVTASLRRRKHAASRVARTPLRPRPILSSRARSVNSHKKYPL